MSEHLFFPLYVDISNKKIVLFGAGKIASRRAETLLKFTEHLTVVAPEVSEKIAEYISAGRITWHRDRYREDYLQGADLVFGVTNDRVCNREIAGACKRMRIPVNICDEKELCDFYFPSAIVDGDIVIGVNASGRDHGKVKETRMKIEEMLG